MVLDGRPPYLRPRTVADSTVMREPVIQGPPPVPEIRIKALSQFPGDQTFTAGASNLDVNLTQDGQWPYTLIRGLRGFRLINLVGTVAVDVNGGGLRSVIDKDTWDFVNVTSLRLFVLAGGSITLQQWGE